MELQEETVREEADGRRAEPRTAGQSAELQAGGAAAPQAAARETPRKRNRGRGRNRNRNYQRELDALILDLQQEGSKPSLLLHSCCAPCSSYVLEYLSQYFAITLLYYNPNIDPLEEYQERIHEQQRLIREMEAAGALGIPVRFLEGKYEPEAFYRAVRGHEREKEGGERCFICYELRLRMAAMVAKEGGFDYFTTTLSISPKKNAAKLNEIGERLAEEYGLSYLMSDFKKKNGHNRSTELSEQYHLYRQDYCGCVYSKQQRMAMLKAQAEPETPSKDC